MTIYPGAIVKSSGGSQSLKGRRLLRRLIKIGNGEKFPTNRKNVIGG